MLFRDYWWIIMSTLTSDVEHDVERVLDQASTYSEAQLLSGLAVLVADAKEFFDLHPGEAADLETFRSVYGETVTTSGFWSDWYDRKEWELELWDEVAGVTGLEPGELTERAAAGSPDVAALGDPGIEHEWFMAPGAEFLDRFGEKLRETVCGPGGPYEQFEDGLVGQEQLPKVIVTTLLTAGFSGGAVWVPMTVYVGLLLVEAGLKTYCETPSAEVGELL